MKQTLSATTLERLLPIYSVENGFIISKYGDITAAFQIRLPEIFSVSEEEYESIHQTWVKALKVLPDYTIVHKQDWYVEDVYNKEFDFKKDYSFLEKSSELHFFERPFLNHYCYLYISMTDKKRFKSDSSFSTLSRKNLIPSSSLDETKINIFIESIEQLERMFNDSSFFKITRLSEDEIIGTSDKIGVIEKYLSLTQENSAQLEDISLHPTMSVGSKKLCYHTISELTEFPDEVSSSLRNETLSNSNTSCNLSFAAPIGLFISCNHIYNQYIFLDNAQDIKQSLEKKAGNMNSLSTRSRVNTLNKLAIDNFLDIVQIDLLRPVRAHYNVLTWADNETELRRNSSTVFSQMANVCHARHNTVDCPTLFWSGIPGNAGDFPYEETCLSVLEHALCFFTQETNYKDSLSPFGVKMIDPLSGRPVHLDISNEPMKMGIIDNMNKFILGPSGSGKSFFTNHILRQYYEQQAHIIVVDIGGSYKAHCEIINEETRNNDGIYYTYTIEKPIAFNLFYTESNKFELEKMEYIKALILTLWKSEGESVSSSEVAVLSKAVNMYINKITALNSAIQPSFNTFYEFIKNEFSINVLSKDNVKESEFDVGNFLLVLQRFYRGGEYDFLLNSNEKIDLLSKRFVVFDLDKIKENKILFPVVTMIIMDAFMGKMRFSRTTKKVLLIEEAWKAISNGSMAEYMRAMVKTVRKYNGETIVVTQEIDDIISSPIVKDAIINNSDIKILLDQTKNMNKFESIENLLGLSKKDTTQIMTINKNKRSGRGGRDVWISLGRNKSAVYTTEVSEEEYWTYTSQGDEREKLFALALKMGSLKAAIAHLANEKRNSSLNNKNEKDEK